MIRNTLIGRYMRLLAALFLLLLLAPSALMAAEDWSYPTEKPSAPFGGGNGKKDNPYIISTAQHLANLAYMVTSEGEDYEGKYFLQTRDIVLNDDVLTGVTKESNGSIRYSKNAAHFDALKQWQPIGMYGKVYDDDFEGIYDGGGHSVSGVYCRKPLETSSKAYRYIGLFACCENARISNLTIKDSFYSFVKGDNYLSLGALAGLVKSTTITNCHAENCVISGDGDVVFAAMNVGGLLGEVEGAFTGRHCSFSGVVDVYVEEVYSNFGEHSEHYVGGLIGAQGYKKYIRKSFALENCSTSGQIVCHEATQSTHYRSHWYYVGGVVGAAMKASAGSNGYHIVRCVNRMNINVFDEDSDVPFPLLRNIRVAGIVGEELNCTECANYGSLHIGKDNRYNVVQLEYDATINVDGICTGGKADNCFNYGDLRVAPMKTSSTIKIGQWMSESGTVDNCFALNNVSYDYADGGETFIMASTDDVKIKNSRYCVTVTGNRRPSQELKGDIEEADFKSQDYVEKLNAAAGASKYGLIKQSGNPYDGYLMLTSLGAMANSLYGHGTEDDPFVIGSAADLSTLAYMFTTGNDFNGKLFKLTANIDMTNEPELAAIGSTDHPFSGIFDGGGHYIRGLKATDGCLFDRVTGTVKNLALDGLRSQDDHLFAGIAYNLGAENVGGGRIENCYVIGNPTLKVNSGGLEVNVGGICYKLWKGASIADCYFTGNVTIANAATGSVTIEKAINVGGIATTAETGASIERCYAVVGYDADTAIEGLENSCLGGIVADDEGKPTLLKNFYHIDIAATSQKPMATRNFNGTESRAEYGISAGDLGDKFANGWFYPVLKAVYHYDCKDYEGNAVALDPAGYAPATNDILTLVPTDEQKEDTKMWQLPNVAVYSEEYGAEMLTNFTIIPDAGGKNYPLRYKPGKDGVGVKGLATYPWKVDRDYANWGAFCLPGSVALSNLPEGCKLYVGGKYEKGKMNIVEVESVPAGVPFLVRYDNRADVDTVFITMTGDLVMQPQTADAASSLKGTFSPVEDSYIHFTVYEETEDGNTRLYMHNSSSVDCFRAYVVGDNTGLIELTDYLLLDEQSNKIDDIIADHKGKSVKVKLRRSIKTGGWNTVCLPFGVSSDDIADALGSGTSVEELTSVGYDATTGSVVMQFGKASEIEAGKPYLVYPKREATIFDLGSRTVSDATEDKTFKNVTLGDGSAANISMVGSFGKAYLASTDEENHYFLQADKFYRATSVSPVVMSGFRCWFKVTDASGRKAQTLNAARVVHADGTATDIRLIDTGLGTAGTRIYDIRGIRHYEMQRGLNIVGGKKVVKK